MRGGRREWVEARRGDPLTAADIRALPTPGVAVVSLVELHQEVVAFVLSPGSAAPAVVVWPVVREQVEECVVRLHAQTSAAGRRDAETWHESVVPFVREIARHVGGAARVLLSAHSLTSLIPWHVVAHRAGWEVAMAGLPTFGLLPSLRRRARRRAAGALIVGDPVGNLPYARDEAEVVARERGTTPLVGERATSERVLAGMAGAEVIHLATHAWYDRNSLLDSGIRLADRMVPVRELLGRRLAAELVVLSACETGRLDSFGGNEYMSIGQAFLGAGARAVIMSLWPVDDKATSAFMQAFYGELDRGRAVVDAVRAAETQVRTTRRWSHSAFWGPFVVLGDPDARVGDRPDGDRSASG